MSHTSAVSRLSLSRKQKKYNTSAVASLAKSAPNVAHGSAAGSSKAGSLLAGPPRLKLPSATSLLRGSLDSDSDWESSSDSEGPAAQVSVAPAGTAPTADSQPRAALLAEVPQAAATAAEPNASPARLRLSEIYDLCDTSDEDAPDARGGAGGAAVHAGASAAPEQPQRAAAASSLPQPGQATQPSATPQHRKRSFDQEEAQQPTAAHPGLHALATAQPESHQERGQPAQQPCSGMETVPSGEAMQDEGLADTPEYQAVKSWLQGLGLAEYFGVFLKEEIDLSIVHALTPQDLSDIGITHKPHQQAILAAGRKREAHRRAQQPAVTPARQPFQPLAAQKQQQWQQDRRPGAVGQHPAWGSQQQQQRQGAAQGPAAPAKGGQGAGRGGHQTLLQAWQANNAAQAAAATCVQPQLGCSGSWKAETWAGSSSPPAGEAGEGSLRDAGTRPKERALLSALYPPNPASDGGPPAPHPPPWRQQQQQQRRQLQPSTAAAEARVPAEASLWTAAGQCRQVVPGIEERLSRRRAEAGLDSPPREQLARGGTAYQQVGESRELKMLKLEGLRKELAMHEETVAQLRSMIAALESELQR